MAKDDYFVLVYKILRHLYDCLKDGYEVNWNELKPGTRQFPIGEEYWNYIWRNLITEGYVEGASVVPILGSDPKPRLTENLKITPKGIEYLEENSMMKKVFEGLKSAKDLIPFM